MSEPLVGLGTGALVGLETPTKGDDVLNKDAIIAGIEQRLLFLDDTKRTALCQRSDLIWVFIGIENCSLFPDEIAVEQLQACLALLDAMGG